MFGPAMMPEPQTTKIHTLPQREGTRLLIETPPPLAPDSPAWPAPLPTPRRHERLLFWGAALALALVLAMAAGLAILAGLPALATLLACLAGSGLLFYREWTSRKQLAFANAELLQARAEASHLATRMEQLRESEMRARGLADALGDLVVHRDRDGRIVYANQVLQELVGLSAPALIGRRLNEIGINIGIVPDGAFSNDECLSSTDVAIQTANGERWFSWIELSVRNKQEGAVWHRAIAREITARKSAEAALNAARERAEAANEAKSRFLATVSHEIRTPMNGIMGMAQLLAATRLTLEQNTYVTAVSTSSAALLALIDDLLDFSRIEFGRLDIEPQPVSPRELVENVVELLAPRAHDKGIGIGCHVEPQVPSLIAADPGRLRQVLINIIGNAVKFTAGGGVLVAVEMSQPADKNAEARIRFCVTDTGPGLKPEDISRIFEEFEQGDSAPTRRHGGAGLGLAISRRIVEAMEGSISAEALPGGGSRFTVELPARDGIALPLDPSSALAERKIAIISANSMEAQAIALTISAHGGEAGIFHTLGEAAKAGRARQTAYDTVLVDAALEYGEGGLLQDLRLAGMDAGLAVTLIAPADRSHLAAYRISGYDSFLVRPVRGATLLRVLLSQPQGTAMPDRDKAGSGNDGERQTSSHRLRILVAEDNDINALLVRATLSKAGHAVDVVANGKLAVEALTQAGGAHRYDLVLMDLDMPVMDGLQAISHIRRHEEKNFMAAVPILVLSADNQEKTRHGVIAHGATSFLTKPVDPQAMIEAVESHAFA